MEKIMKNSPTKHSSILANSIFFKEKDNIPTDLPILNIAFSGSPRGGLSSGLTVLAGQSKSFKTMLGLYCVKAYLEKYPDAVCVFYDSEGGVTPEYLDSNGIDSKRVFHVPIEHIEMLKFDMVKTLKGIERSDKVIMMIDSIGNTASLKELEDAENEKSVAEMQRAKSLKALFRMVTPSLISKDVPCISVAHTYETMTLYSKSVISGGTGLMYSANQAFIISKAQEKEGTDLAGWKFTINIEKSRYVKEKSKLPFSVFYDSGIYKWSSLFELALEAGYLIKPKMGWYQKVDPDTGEVFESSFREKQIKADDSYFKMLLDNDNFVSFVEKKYKLSGEFTQATEDSENDFQEDLDTE